MEHLAVLHADCDDVDEFVAQLRPFYPDEIVVGQIGPVVGAHAGLGTIGVAFHETTRVDPTRAGPRPIRHSVRAPRTLPQLGGSHH